MGLTGLSDMKKLIAVFLLFCAVPAFADYDKALALFKQKKYQESLKECADALEVSKDGDPAAPNYKIRYLASQNHRRLGNSQAAVAHLQRCADIKPKSADPLIDLAFLNADLGKYNEAKAYAQKALALEPKNAAAFYSAGYVQYRMGVFWGAKELLEKALALDPELYPAWNTLGLSLMQLKKYPDANTAFSTALAWYPDTAEFLNNLAVSLSRMGKNAEALKYAARAAELAPQNEQIRRNREALAKAK
jgi:tetratricopeptide (TPR) repeat protein